MDLCDNTDVVAQYSALSCALVFMVLNVAFAYNFWTARQAELKKLTANRAECLATSKHRNLYACGELVVEHDLCDAKKGHYYGCVAGGDPAALVAPISSVPGADAAL